MKTTNLESRKEEEGRGAVAARASPAMHPSSHSADRKRKKTKTKEKGAFK